MLTLHTPSSPLSSSTAKKDTSAWGKVPAIRSPNGRIHLCGVEGKQTEGNDICMAIGITIRCSRDARCPQCTGKRLSHTIWSSFNKDRMSHLCDSTVAGPTARRDNVLASKCEYPPFRYPPFKFAPKKRRLFRPGLRSSE